MTTPTALTLEQRLENIEKSLARTSAGIARTAMFSRFVGVVLLCLMGGYFAYGYGEAKALIDPKFLVPFLGNMVEDSIPEVRKTLNETVATLSPVWAENLSSLAIQSAPQAREGLENYVLDQASTVLDAIASQGEDGLQNVVRENRTELQQAIRQLVDGQEFSDETLSIFTKALDEELGRDLQEQAHAVLGTLIGLKEKLQRLSQGKSLSREEQHERHTLMTIHYLQLRESDEEFETRLKPSSDRQEPSKNEAVKPTLNDTTKIEQSNPASVKHDQMQSTDSEQKKPDDK